MLYSILTIILAVYACITPYFYAKAVKFGVKLAEHPEKAAEEPIFNVPERKKDTQSPEVAEALRKQAILERNLEHYDGTSMGQEEIF